MNNRKCECLLISQHFLHSAYGFFFFSCKVPTLDIWPQIIHPPKSTTLPRPWQTWKIKEEIWIHAHAPNQINMGKKNIKAKDILKKSFQPFTRFYPTSWLWHLSPVPDAVSLDISHQLLIFFGAPLTFIQCILLIAMSPPHLYGTIPD